MLLASHGDAPPLNVSLLHHVINHLSFEKREVKDAAAQVRVCTWCGCVSVCVPGVCVHTCFSRCVCVCPCKCVCVWARACTLISHVCACMHMDICIHLLLNSPLLSFLIFSMTHRRLAHLVRPLVTSCYRSVSPLCSIAFATYAFLVSLQIFSILKFFKFLGYFLHLCIFLLSAFFSGKYLDLAFFNLLIFERLWLLLFFCVLRLWRSFRTRFVFCFFPSLLLHLSCLIINIQFISFPINKHAF